MPAAASPADKAMNAMNVEVQEVLKEEVPHAPKGHFKVRGGAGVDGWLAGWLDGWLAGWAKRTTTTARELI